MLIFLPFYLGFQFIFFYETMPRLFLGILLYGIGSLVDNYNGFPYDYYRRLCKMAC